MRIGFIGAGKVGFTLGKYFAVNGLDVAGYYPDALQMSIKITFSPADGKLLGAQIVGYSGVDKRIDEFSQVIKHSGTVYDLMALEQAYAPPFSSAKDPVAVTGYVAGLTQSSMLSLSALQRRSCAAWAELRRSVRKPYGGTYGRM